MFNFKAVVSLGLLLSSLLAQPQSLIVGVVVDEETGEPLEKASVRLLHDSTFTVANKTGAFQLNTPRQTHDTLVVTHMGYRQRLIPVPQNNRESIVIGLEREALTLGEIEVFSQFWLKQYKPAELKEDYVKFYTLMEKVHTALFDYLAEEEWTAMKDSSMNLCERPMTHAEFYRLIAWHVGKVRNMHTRHGVTDWWYRQKQNIFPFNIRYFDERLFINESLAPGLTYPRGTEILAVNGRTPAQIKDMIWPFIPADGYNITGKMAALNDYFPWFYSLFVEETESYSIKIKTLAGADETVETLGLGDSFRHLSFAQLWRWRKSALELQIDDNLKAAYLRIEDSRVFKDSIVTFFNRILDRNVEHLIIDLRGSGGIREEDQVAELYSYLIDKPSRIYERLEIKSNDPNLFDKDFTFRPYAKSRKQIKQFYDRLVDSGQGYYLWQQESYMQLIPPAKLHYSGRVYLLTDGRNYSASTDFTSLAAQLDNVVTIGEETGGEYRAYVSGAMYGLVLPNSKIGVKIPTWKSILAVKEDPSNRGRGVLPDFPVTQSFDDFVAGRDSVKEFAFELVRKK